MIEGTRKQARYMAISTREAQGPMFQHVTNLVTDGVKVMVKSVNLHDEVSPEIDSSPISVSPHGSAICMGENKDKFQKMQESLILKEYLAHSAMRQLLPEVIESVCQCNTRRPNKIRQHSNTNRIMIDKSKKAQQRQRQKGKSPHSKNHKVLIETEKNDVNPPVFEIDINRKSMQRKLFAARGA